MMRCPHVLADGLCATSRVPSSRCPVHGQRRQRTVATDDGRAAEMAAEQRYWSTRTCRHRGESIGTVACAACSGTINLPAFACPLHSRCTELRRAAEPGIKWCHNCPDYAQKTDVARTDSPSLPGAASGETTVAPVAGIRKPWLGTVRRQSWDYPCQLVMAHWNTPDILRLGIELWRQQTVRPFICIVDTGSTDAIIAELRAMEADDVEVHFLRARDYPHPSAPVAAAMDVAAARCHQEYQVHTHTDVYPRRRDLLEWMLGQCSRDVPVVGYEISPRDMVHGKLSELWPGMVGHTMLALHSATMRAVGAQWHMQAGWDEYGLARDVPGDIDTEVPFNLRLRDAGIVPKLIGHDTNYEHFRDANIDHFRSYGSSLLYQRDYHETAKAWAETAMAEARQRLQDWRHSPSSDGRHVATPFS